MKSPSRRKPAELAPWSLPIERIPADAIIAVKALADGKADEHQQRRALRYVLELCGLESDSTDFWPGGEDGRRATDFALGRKWPAQQLRRITRMQPRGFDPRGEPPPMPGEPRGET